VRTKPGRTITNVEQVTLTECAVLGLLSDQERSGYDLLKTIERSVGFFWTPAKSQLYALLPKLVERGLARARRVEQDKRPDKTLYRITPAGREALRIGLEQASPAVDRNPFELRIFFGEHMRHGAVRRMVEARRDQQRAHLATLEQIERDVDVDAHLYPYLTLLAGKENARAAIRWAEQALKLLDDHDRE
jgi:DNA-binding PadR family transcriptional regulator